MVTGTVSSPAASTACVTAHFIPVTPASALLYQLRRRLRTAVTAQQHPTCMQWARTPTKTSTPRCPHGGGKQGRGREAGRRTAGATGRGRHLGWTHFRETRRETHTKGV